MSYGAIVGASAAYIKSKTAIFIRTVLNKSYVHTAINSRSESNQFENVAYVTMQV